MSTPLVLFFITCLLALAPFSHQVSLPNGVTGFGLKLIHRDSRLSPLHDPSIVTLSDRAKVMQQRSVARLQLMRQRSNAAHLRNNSIDNCNKSIDAPVRGYELEYLFQVGLGYPEPVNVTFLADTGSDLIWVQCQPCDKCHRQYGPNYDPSRSTYHRLVPCDEPRCLDAPEWGCDSSGETCTYKIQYVDGSVSTGEVATDGFRVHLPETDTSTTIGDVALGCGRNNSVSLGPAVQGIMGLSGGPLSFVSQMDVNGQFSYCLEVGVRDRWGKMLFGSAAMLLGNSTPLSVGLPGGFYIINLVDISVSRERLNIPPEAFEGEERGLIVDSGAPMTYLKKEVYYFLEDKLSEVIGLERSDTNGYLCFLGDEEDMSHYIPNITFHFETLDVLLGYQSTFLMFRKGLMCLTIKPDDSLSLFGNLAQRDLIIGYDIPSKKLYMHPMDCDIIE